MGNLDILKKDLFCSNDSHVVILRFYVLGCNTRDFYWLVPEIYTLYAPPFNRATVVNVAFDGGTNGLKKKEAAKAVRIPVSNISYRIHVSISWFYLMRWMTLGVVHNKRTMGLDVQLKLGAVSCGEHLFVVVYY